MGAVRLNDVDDIIFTGWKLYIFLIILDDDIKWIKKCIIPTYINIIVDNKLKV